MPMYCPRISCPIMLYMVSLVALCAVHQFSSLWSNVPLPRKGVWEYGLVVAGVVLVLCTCMS